MRVFPLCKARDNFPQYTAVTAPTSHSPANTGRNNYLPPPSHHLHATSFSGQNLLSKHCMDQVYCIGARDVYVYHLSLYSWRLHESLWNFNHWHICVFLWDCPWILLELQRRNRYLYFKIFFLNLPCRFDVLLK